LAAQWSIEYSLVLDPVAGDAMRVRIRTRRGQVVDFVVQYEAEIDGQTVPVVRYDASHGQAHRDLLDNRGRTIDGSKVWLPAELGHARAIEYARQDIRQNWRRYRAEFIRRRRHE
jgi:hypothetical protein